MSTKTKTNKVALTVSFNFMKHALTFNSKTLERAIKAAIANKPPRDATHYKHQIHLPKTLRGLVNHPVTYVWFAEEVLGVPAMCLTNDGQSMRGAYNPGQVVGTVNRHLSPLGMSATSTAPVQALGTFQKENGKTGKAPKGADLQAAKTRAVNAHKRLIENMNKAELQAAKQRAKKAAKKAAK